MAYTSNSDKITREYFDSLLVETRYLDSVLPTVKMELFGQTFDTPIMTAALSHLHNKIVVGDASVKNGMSIYAEAAARVFSCWMMARADWVQSDCMSMSNSSSVGAGISAPETGDWL